MGHDPQPNRARLERAYRATTYWVDLPAGRLTLRIGEPCPELDCLLALHHLCTWALLTAHNPGSQPLLTDENQHRHNELQLRVRAIGHPHYASRAEADSGTWPPEAGFLIVGIDEATAIALARHFQQAAIVVGDADGVPKLLWTN